ncbi:MAG: GTP cyclohydrolase [Gammaproteobacteria bacterium CG11_big_fil_rev_8_21_14_0_20_46_22]|nr:MAG: GTP cyclohydrolase [Gammaproteobacteria bacterium CG12_big_fil_rev_8_21_14_0_65_46_12]PIR11450.1 MAG: GTP cyclohydrolase [Gammaproteobacteria bacterium CG11_big_fil_rev_8_21_14_0_20_46_22]
MLIAISKYLTPLDEVDVHRAKHHQYLKPLFESKKLLIAGRQNNDLGGVIIARTLSKEEFEQILAQDPFTMAGVSKYTIYEFTPSFYDECFANRFEC